MSVGKVTHGRDLYLLMAQLEFERLLKRRYLQQISKLQRKNVVQSTIEAERKHYVTEIADLEKRIKELQKDLQRQQQALAESKRAKASSEEKLYREVTKLQDEKHVLKSEVEKLTVDTKRLKVDNSRLLKHQVSLGVELSKSRQGSQEALDQGSSAAAAQIESLKLEIAEWKDKVGSQRELQIENQKLDATCKWMELKLSRTEDSNRTLSRRIKQLTDEVSNGVKQPHSEAKIRNMIDSVNANHTAEMNRLRDSYDALKRQYRSLEETYREVQLLHQEERRAQMTRQTSLVSLNSIEETYSQHSDPRTHHWAMEDHDNVSGGSSDSATLATTSADVPPSDIPMVAPQSHGTALSMDPLQSPFPHLPSRRRTSSAGSSVTIKSATPKIKTNSEVRVYGRYFPREELF
jgi:chromosome segregation ATPase